MLIAKKTELDARVAFVRVIETKNGQIKKLTIFETPFEVLPTNIDYQRHKTTFGLLSLLKRKLMENQNFYNVTIETVKT